MIRLMNSLLLIFMINLSWAATYTVTNTNDLGAGSLRQAIEDANANINGPHTITFNIAGAGLHEINLNTALPWFADQDISVDGTTQPGYVDTPIIQINGSGIAGWRAGFGYWFSTGGEINAILINDFTVGVNFNGGSNITISNCQIQNCSDQGLFIWQGSQAITAQNNFIGPNQGNAIQINGGTNHVISGNSVMSSGNGIMATESASVTIGPDNTISGHVFNGIDANDNSSITVFGNVIGLDTDHSTVLSNGTNGISVTSGNTIKIGGNGNDSLNVISGNSANGVVVDGTNNIQVYNNIIGLDPSGTIRKGNNTNGITLLNSHYAILGKPNQGNIVSGNANSGINIQDDSQNTIIQGNFLGTNFSGTDTIANAFHGIQVLNTANTVLIGGPNANEGNLISGNGFHGIWMTGNPYDITIEGNIIGTDLSGNLIKGNNHNGVSSNGVTDVTINDNLISGNGYDPYLTGVPYSGPIFSGIGMGGCSDIIITNNKIGTDLNGNTSVPNSNGGIWFSEAENITIGEAGNGNLISGNGGIYTNPGDATEISPENMGGAGVYITSCTGHTKILGNIIGANETGTLSLPNLGDGTVVLWCNDSLQIGGEGDSSNVFAGNGYNGLYLYQNNASTTVKNNYFGTTANDATLVGNGKNGLYLNGQSNALITQNTSSYNEAGIDLFNSTGNKIESNTSTNNQEVGIRVENGERNKIELNTIRNNPMGVFVGGTSATSNRITQNTISCNNEDGINLSLSSNLFGVNGPGNQGKESPYIDPAVSNASQTIGTGNPGDTIELFSNPSLCGCEGEVYIGFAVVDINGDWTINHNAVIDTTLISATTTENGNTSEFVCKKAIAGNFNNADNSTVCLNETKTIELANFDGSYVIWQFASETNFNSIISQDTSNAVGTSSFLDFTPTTEGTIYVRAISFVTAQNADTSLIFSFNVDPIPSYSSIAAIEDTICSGSSSNISLSNVYGEITWYTSIDGITYSSLQNESDPTVTVIPSSSSFYKASLKQGVCSIETDSVSVTVLPIINPSVSIDINENNLCDGETAVFRAEVLNAGSQANFDWLINGLSISETLDSLRINNLNHNDTISLIVTTDTVCAPSTVASNQIIFTEQSLVSPSVEIAGNAPSCSNQSLTLTANASPGTLEWFVNGSSTIRSSAVESFETLNNGDTISVVLTSSETCVQQLTDSTAVTVTIVESLSPVIEIEANKTSACENENVFFTAQIAEAGDAHSITWFVNDTETHTGNSYFSTFKTGDRVHAVLNSTGSCVTTNQVISNAIQLNITSVTTPSVSLNISENTQICENEDLVLTATISSGSLSWYINGVETNRTSLNETFSGLEDGSEIMAILSSDAECTTASSDTATITVNTVSILNPSITISSEDTDVCEGESIAFSSSISEAGNSPEITWYVNGTSTETGASFTNNFSDNDIIHAVLNTTGSCMSVTETTSNTLNVTVNQSVTPSVSLAAKSQFICTGMDGSVSISSSNNEGENPRWYWYLDNELISNDSSTQTFSNLSIGSHEIKLNMSSDITCATGTIAEDMITITVEALEVPTLSISSNYSSCLPEGSTVFFNANHSMNGSESSYSWYKNDILIPGANSLSYSSSDLTSGDKISAQVISTEECLTENTLTDSETIQFSRPVTAEAGNDITLTQSKEISPNGSNSQFEEDPFISFQWSKLTNEDTFDISSQLLTSDLAIKETQQYVFTISNQFCYDSDTITVSIDFGIDIPNAFSPNDDGTHDEWVIENLEKFENAHIEIYNRWGSLIYETDNYTPESAWNGTYNGDKLPTGTYYYILKVDSEDINLAGWVSLLK